MNSFNTKELHLEIDSIEHLEKVKTYYIEGRIHMLLSDISGEWEYIDKFINLELHGIGNKFYFSHQDNGFLNMSVDFKVELTDPSKVFAQPAIKAVDLEVLVKGVR